MKGIGKMEKGMGLEEKFTPMVRFFSNFKAVFTRVFSSMICLKVQGSLHLAMAQPTQVRIARISDMVTMSRLILTNREGIFGNGKWELL